MYEHNPPFPGFLKPVLLFLGSLWCASLGFSAEPGPSAPVQAQKQASSSAKGIDALATETQAMLQEYRQILGELNKRRTENDQLERLLEQQKNEVDSFTRQSAHLIEIQRGILPLMLRMLKVLEDFIALDTPFLLDERKTRLQELKAMMDSPEVSLAEKYRRLLEAYQIETDYGRTIEAYSGTLEKGGQNRTVDFLRAGRLTLVYATLDGAETGYWDPSARAWKVLPRDYNEPILKALRVTRKQAPPDLIKLPIPAPESN